MRFFSLVLAGVALVAAVKTELFKTCDQSGFCHRNRHYAKAIASNPSFKSPYSVVPDSIKFSESESSITGEIEKVLPDGHSVQLPFILDILKDDNVRLRVTEAQRESIKIKNNRLQTKRYDEAWKYALQSAPETEKGVFSKKESQFSVKFGNESQYEVILLYDPFRVDVYLDGSLEVALNEGGLFNVEHYRTSDTQSANMLPEESDYDAFSDSFKDASSDKLPFGPESVGMDIIFPGSNNVYGIPEHADTFALKETTDSDPYRLFNVDIFEYETQSKFPMYGLIPFMIAHKPGHSAGVLWLSAADTYVDIARSNDAIKTHWFSESGIIDVIVMIGKDPLEVSKKYGALLGNPLLPQLFSLGYHQCRWNYNDVDDVLDVTASFDAAQIPYDVIWLDIEYTENKKYFTWKKGLFDDHVGMNKKLAETGRNLVAIIDPHLKTGYEVSDAVESKKIGITNSDNSDTYHGHCWPGESVWIDTFSPEACLYWDGLFKNNTAFSGDETNLHIWNDMAEPSVFSGPETTAPKDIIHYGGWEHRDVHNIYGLTFHEATYRALEKRYGSAKRPFVLTRSYYAGSQRTAAAWSGDNRSKWEFLKMSLPMALTSQVVGMPFTGSDVGGFFGDPSPELLVRWYQAGIWYPFFRAHAHIDSKRREPYIAGGEYTDAMRDAILTRYALLPVFYTAFHDASVNNTPVLLPLLYSHPENPESFAVEDEFFIGNSGLLVKPVTDEGATSVSIYLPDELPYHNYKTYEKLQGKGNHEISVDLNSIPVFIRGGHIFARKDRYRRSSKLMRYDPYTLVVAVHEGKAKGSLYIDDGETTNYKNGEYLEIDFEYENGVLNAGVLKGAEADNLGLLNKVKVERIIIVGAEAGETAKVSQDGNEWDVELLPAGGAIIVRNPAVVIGENWTVSI